METVGQEDSIPPAPLRKIHQKSGPPSCYVRTRSQEWDKANNVAVRRSTKKDLQYVVDCGSTRKRGDREVKVRGAEKVVKTGGGSDMTNKMGVKVGCVGDYGDIAVGKKGGSSKMISYLLKNKNKQMVSYLVKGN